MDNFSVFENTITVSGVIAIFLFALGETSVFFPSVLKSIAFGILGIIIIFTSALMLDNRKKLQEKS